MEGKRFEKIVGLLSPFGVQQNEKSFLHQGPRYYFYIKGHCIEKNCTTAFEATTTSKQQKEGRLLYCCHKNEGRALQTRVDVLLPSCPRSLWPA